MSTRRARQAKTNNTVRMSKKAMVMEVIDEHEVVDHSLGDNSNENSAEFDLTEPSNIDVLLHDIETQKEFRAQNLKNVVNDAEKEMMQAVTSRALAMPKEQRNMTLVEYQRKFGGDIVNLFHNHVKIAEKDQHGQKRILAESNAANGSNYMQTPAPTNGTKSIFGAMQTPATVVRKQRIGESIKEAVIMGVSENGSPIEIDIESDVAAMTIAATVKKRRANVFGHVHKDSTLPFMPSSMELASMHPDQRAEISKIYQDCIAKIGNVISIGRR
uniref:Uncharacterized protein n=1 Tax=Leptocylindrus danicus TaxID=163516 RepID=A0A7S2K587_9STRA